MTLRKDKKKVIGEIFDDERVKSFLSIETPPGINPDYHRLERAYRSMKAENFATFVKFFAEAGCDINATNPDGHTLLQVISEHRYAGEYIEPLKDAGAK